MNASVFWFSQCPMKLSVKSVGARIGFLVDIYVYFFVLITIYIYLFNYVYIKIHTQR